MLILRGTPGADIQKKGSGIKYVRSALVMNRRASADGWGLSNLMRRMILWSLGCSVGGNREVIV